jgi:hypothetical protein
MHFADRKFYDAWWNSGSMGAYWRLWNIPVHGYFKRHIYVPLRRRGWSSRMASTVVFVISAVIHELLLGVPTHAVPSPLKFSCLIYGFQMRLMVVDWSGFSGDVGPDSFGLFN